MTAQQLKNSILQMAVQGKLVMQNPDDVPASVLLDSIKVDRQNISEDEIPFDIPESWEWVRIEDLAKSYGTESFADGPFGSNLKKEHQISQPEVRIIQLSNLGEFGWKNDNVKYTSYEHLKTISRCEVKPGDFVIAKMMPAGRTVIVPDLGTKICLGSDAIKFVPHESLYKYYLYYAMHSNMFLSQVVAETHGVTRIRTSLNKLKKYILPIPPLEEQKRIVSKIEELLPFIDKYGKAEEQLTALNAKFPDTLKKSILQEAVQGKLVPQDKNDEPASVLLERIKEGKIKKEKPLAPITEEEIPFEIPESWKWIRLDYICEIARGGSPRPIKEFLTEAPDGINWIKIGDSDKGGKYINSTKEKIKPEGMSKSRFVHAGDFLLTNSMSFGRPYILNVDGCIHDGWLVLSDYHIAYDKDFLYYLLSSRFAYYQFCDVVSGAVVKNLNSDKVANAIFPLPPLSEQKRIVKKIEELMQYCDRL